MRVITATTAIYWALSARPASYLLLIITPKRERSWRYREGEDNQLTPGLWEAVWMGTRWLCRLQKKEVPFEWLLLWEAEDVTESDWGSLGQGFEKYRECFKRLLLRTDKRANEGNRKTTSCYWGPHWGRIWTWQWHKSDHDMIFTSITLSLYVKMEKGEVNKTEIITQDRKD